MKIVSQRCEQARWGYNGVLSEVEKEIPDYKKQAAGGWL
jgi:hypothetical protein